MIVLPIVLGSAIVLPTTTGPAAEPAAAAVPATLQEEAEEPDGLWHGYVNLGVSKSEGNADIQTYSLDARAQREYDVHRYTLEALWYYAEDDDRPGETLIQRRALGSAKYDQFLTERTYLWANALAETNFAAAMDLRWTVGAGVGHQWRDDSQWKINTEIGLAYFDETYDTPNVNGEISVEYVAARLAWDIWTQVTETLAFGNFGELYPSLEDKDDVYGRMTTYLEATLSDNLKARLSWLLVYDNTPAADRAGNSLERADNLYLLTVGWTF